MRDHELFDAALAALVRASRTAEIDSACTAYDDHPLDDEDEWGDLAVAADRQR